MAGLPSLESPLYSVQLFRNRFALSERRAGGGEGHGSGEGRGVVSDADLVAADDTASVGTLQTFGESGAGVRGRLSLAGPVELQLTMLHPARLALSATGVAVAAEFKRGATIPPFLRFAIDGVSSPVVSKVSDSVVTLALDGGEYFFELRPAPSATDAETPRRLNRATHFTARREAEAAAG